SPPGSEGEQRLGIGAITLFACVLGLYLNRDSPRVRLIVWVGVLLFACVAAVPRGLVLGASVVASLLAVSVLFHRRGDDPTWQWVVPATILGFLQIRGFASDEANGIALFTLI